MAFIIKDRVKEGTTSTGTGDVSLGGAAATFDTFQSYMTNGDTTYYAIVHTTSGTDEWEVGLGTWNTGNTLTRTTVLAGSNGTSAVNFSSGTKDIFMTYPAAHAALAGDDVNFANITVTGTVDGRDVAADGTKLDTVEQNADVTDTVNVAAAGALMKSGGTMTGNLILNADPTTALGAATKEYVDTIASAGIHYHDPVRVETPSALTASYNNGSSGVGATLTNSGTQAALVIDGVTMALNDRVLVYNQTDETHNGIYTVTNVGSASTNWVMTRATDADSYGASDPDSFGKGDAFFVKEGNTGAGELYVMTTAGTITFGTTAIHFSQVAETAVYSAGTGISLNGTTFSIGQDVGTTDNVTFNQVTATIIGNVTGNLTGDVTGNADTATALETARTIQLSGDVTGSATFDGTANVTITAAVQDDSHAHVISNVDGLQAALDAKADDTTTITAGDGLTGGGSIGVNRTLNVGAGSGISVTADAVAHADTSSQASVNNSGNTFIQDVTLDGFGHVTGLTSGSVTVGDATITIAAGGGLQTGGDFTTNQSTNETITLAHADTSSQASVNNSNGTVIQDITLDDYGHLTGVNSVNLDSRYYTETEADSRFWNASGDLTITGKHKITQANSGTEPYIALTIENTGTSAGIALDANSGSGRQYEIQSSTGGDFFIYDRDANAYRFYISNSGALYNGQGTNRIFADNYHPNADKWTTARTLSLSGDASGSVSWDGSANATLSVTVANDSHTHDGRYYTESEADGRFLRSDADDSATGFIDFTTGAQFGHIYVGGTSSANSSYDRTIKADDSSGLYLNYDGGGAVITNYTNSGGYLQDNQSVRAPIFYDSNNTAYYGDFAATNSSASVNVAGEYRTGGSSWYLFSLGARGASSGQYGMGNRSDNGYRQLTFHVPNQAAYSSSGTIPSFGWYSNGAQQLMKLESATANLTLYSGSVSLGYDVGSMDNTIGASNWFRSSGQTGWYNGTYGGGIYMTDSTWVRTYNSKAFWSASTIQSDNNVRAPIFYDSNDTAYYVNPADGTTSARLNGDIYMTGGKIHVKRGTGLTTSIIDDDSSANGRGQLLLDSHYSDLIIASRNSNANRHGSTLTFATQSTSTNDYAKWVIGQGQYQEGADHLSFAYGTNTSNPHSVLGTDNANFDFQIRNGGIAQAAGDMRAPIFYDSNNTGYYGNFAGMSRIHEIQLGDSGTLAANYPLGIYDTNRYLVGLRHAGSDANYPWLVHDNWNGSAFILHYNGVGDRFYFSEGGIGQAHSDFRAPRFYDSNNTAYYVDPASTSNLDYTKVRGKHVVGEYESVKTWSNGYFAASSTQARRYHVGRLYFCPNHWGDWSNVEIHLQEHGYNQSEMIYNLWGWYGMGNGNSLNLDMVQHKGWTTGDVRISLGSVTDSGWDHSGQNVYYQDVYIDVDYYKSFDVIVKVSKSTITTSNPTSGGWAYVFYNSPSASNISAFGHNHFLRDRYYRQNESSFRAPIFYDSNNTAYYVDPTGSTSAILNGNVIIGQTGVSYTQVDNTPLVGSKTNNRVHINGSVALTNNNDAFVVGNGTGSFFKDEEIGFGWGGGWYMTDGTYLRVRNNKIVYSTGDARFSLYYDSNNTGYYVNPASTSNLNNLTVAGTLNANVAKNGIFWENNQTVTSNYTITNGKNAMSAGPITVNSGVTVTVGDGEAWTVV